MATVKKRKWIHNGVPREKWEVRYFDGTGARRGRTFNLKKEADAFRLKVEREVADGTHISPANSRTVAAAVKLFLENIDAKVDIGALRPCTAKNYHCAFRQAILPAFGDKLMLDVKPEDLEHWYHSVVRTKRMEPVTARRRLWFLKALFAFAIRRRWCSDNPVVAAIEELGAPRQNRIETFALEEVRRVIAAAGEKRYNARQRPHEVTRLAVALAAFCGLRWGEIFGLTIHDVDLPGKTIRIRHSLDGLGNLQEPKTKAGARDVPLPAHIADLLCRFLADWPSQHPAGIIFTSQNGSPMRASNFRQYAWLPLQKRAGVSTSGGDPVRFHALRHFAVSWMIENGWPITDVSAIVGHANVNITLQVYAHVIKGRKQSSEAMQELAEKLLSEGVRPVTQRALTDARVTQMT